MANDNSINSASSAYRRGVVLGMTMAEIFLLLVFCLLIAAAVLFKKHQETEDALTDSNQEQQLQLERLESEVAQLESLIDSFQQQSATTRPDENWRKLVEDQVVMNQAREAGLDIAKLTGYAEDLQQLTPLLEQGTDGETIARNYAIAERLTSSLQSTSLQNASPEEIVELAESGEQQRQGNAGNHNWPPIISLSEAQGYSFETGRAELSNDFRQQLSGSIIDQVADTVRRYDANVVEVVGHTDEQNLPRRVSNLDQSLFGALNSDVPIDTLSPADNTGLGMARAVSVARLLRDDPRLRGVMVLPLSGGQLIQPGDSLTDGTSPGEQASRRRIEIRVRRPG